MTIKKAIKEFFEYNPNVYKVVLLMAGIEYKAESLTIDGALEALGLSWEQIKAKGVVKVSKGDKSIEYLFYVKQLKRIFANKLTRMMWGKRLTMLLGEQK